MKREIKFRGKQKCWEYGGYSNTFGEHQIINDNGSFSVDEKSIGQFTGLKDINGVDIYEGDILKTETDKNMVVGWSEKFASFVINRDGWAFSHWFGEACNPENCEVIGNIHENKELVAD